MRTATALAAILALGGTVAACGSSLPKAASTAAPASASTASASSTTTASPPPAMLTCITAFSDGSTAHDVIATLASDQKSQDAQLQQNWVNYDGSPTSQGNDLQDAVTDFGSHQGGPGSPSQLAPDAANFGTDANTFLQDQSGGLMSGWVPEYRAIQHDLAHLAADCGLTYAVPAGE